MSADPHALPDIPADATDEQVADLLDAAPVPEPRGMSHDHARELFAHLNARIADGETAGEERKALIATLVRFGWTQTTVAELAGMSQQAVSKSLRTEDAFVRSDEDVYVLIGRLLGLAEYAAGLRWGVETEESPSEKLVYKMAGPAMYPVTPASLGQLSAMLAKEVPARGSDALSAAYAEVTAALARVDLPASVPHTDGVWVRVVAGMHRQKAELYRD
ncbi:hypothetical protein ACFRCG_07145 [Embleya sp. NPDC056575]|uniref:hypothetical protein n=1 Tax=unclassified Embleya TaxID=2699296 RepID=UPI00369A47EA